VGLNLAGMLIENPTFTGDPIFRSSSDWGELWGWTRLIAHSSRGRRQQYEYRDKVNGLYRKTVISNLAKLDPPTISTPEYVLGDLFTIEIDSILNYQNHYIGSLKRVIHENDEKNYQFAIQIRIQLFRRLVRGDHTIIDSIHMIYRQKNIFPTVIHAWTLILLLIF